MQSREKKSAVSSSLKTGVILSNAPAFKINFLSFFMYAHADQCANIIAYDLTKVPNRQCSHSIITSTKLCDITVELQP